LICHSNDFGRHARIKSQIVRVGKEFASLKLVAGFWGRDGRT
jgi:hypothetical protein